MAAVDDAMLFGRQLADRAHRLCRDKGMSSAESTSHFLDEVGKRVSDMDAAGESGGVIAAWVEAVVGAYGKRIDELMGWATGAVRRLLEKGLGLKWAPTRKSPSRNG
jgi:hypothetical protein